MGRTRQSRLRPLALLLGAALGLTQVPAAPPAAAVTQPTKCPDVSILEKAEVLALAPGTPLAGFTVEQGNNPSRIDFVVEHVQRDALQDNAPLVVVRATSGSPVTEGKGIWFGMSGSPVYTLDGANNPDALVGAVAFGVAADGESTLAGLQPGYQMDKVRRYPTDGPAVRSVRIDDGATARIAGAAGLPQTSVRRFEPLTVPLALSTSNTRVADVVREGAERAGLRILPVAAGGGTSTASATPTATVRPGDNFVAALSYGYLTAAGTGTTTYVCGNRAMAFGHPFLFTGNQIVGGNAGRNAYVVRDSLFGSYKLARVAGLVGRVDQDRASGIRGLVGRGLRLVPVKSRVAAIDIGRVSNQRTDVAAEDQVPWLSAIHGLTHLDDISDNWGGGSSRLRWVIRGVTSTGREWKLQRGNRYALRGDLNFESIFDLFADLERLQSNRFRKVRFTGISLNAKTVEDVLRYRINRLRIWRNGAYRELDRVQARPGQTLKLEVRLGTGDGNRIVHTEVKVPRNAAGRGRLRVSAATSAFSEDFFFDCLFGPCDGGGSAGSFNELLSDMQDAPRNDVLLAELNMTRFDPESGDPVVMTRSTKQRQDRVVAGRAGLRVRVVP